MQKRLIVPKKRVVGGLGKKGDMIEKYRFLVTK